MTEAQASTMIDQLVRLRAQLAGFTAASLAGKSTDEIIALLDTPPA